MEMLSRDRVYMVTLALTLAAMCAFGLFIVRDYQDQGAIRAVSSGQLPATGSDAGLAVPGAQGTPAPAAAGATTVTGGGSAGAVAAVKAPAASLPGATVQACQGGTIKLGAIIPITGPVTQQTAADALVAYFKDLDSHGGINGCNVDFTYLDDGGLDNQKAAADARELVQEDRVFAIVGNIEPVTTGTTEPYFAQQGVPVVGAEGVGVNEYNSPVEFSFAESPPGFGISTADFAKSKGCHRLAVFYLDFDFGHSSFDALQKQAASNGQTVVYSNAEQISSNSYGTDVIQAQQASPDCVINIMDANSVVREYNAMASNRWYPTMVTTTSSSDPVVNSQEKDWLSNPAHVVYTQRNYQPADASVPEVQAWIQTEGRYFPGFDPNSYAEGSWLGAKVFTDVARRLGGSFTRADLLNALDNLRGYHDGFTPDLTMTSDHGPNRQVMWLQWNAQQTKYVPITGFVPW